MALVPVDKRSGRPRGTSEQERGKLRRERERADYYARNPHLRPRRG